MNVGDDLNEENRSFQRLRIVRPSTAMNELGLVQHNVQFHSHFPCSSNTPPIPMVSLVEILERELNSHINQNKHRIILLSDNLLHIDNKQLRISLENNGNIDIAWTLDVSEE